MKPVVVSGLDSAWRRGSRFSPVSWLCKYVVYSFPVERRLEKRVSTPSTHSSTHRQIAVYLTCPCDRYYKKERGKGVSLVS